MPLTPALAVPEPAGMTPVASISPALVPPAAAAADARQLSRAVARGDEVAFRQLYDAYSERVLRLAVVLVRGDLALARDVAQAVWLLAAHKMRPLQSEAHLWNWLGLITRQQVAKTLRHMASRADVVSLGELPDRPAPAEPDTLIEESLDAAVRSLDGEDQRLIECFYFEHMSCGDIATELATTAKAISSRLERARARLRVFVRRRLAHDT